MSQKKRKYQDNYLDFGFTYLIEDDLQTLQCVVYENIFKQYCTMKAASLKQHLANAHPSMMSKNWSFFESKLSSLKRLECFGALTKPLYMNHMPLLNMWQKLNNHTTLVKPF